MRRASDDRNRAALVGALHARWGEIEQVLLTRVYAVSEPPPGGGPEYVEGLRAAVAAGIDYGLTGIEQGDLAAPPIPEALLSQARLAARSGVSLDTVLRRYFAGHTLIEDFMVEEAERTKLLGATELKRLLRSQAAIVDRLLAAVSEAYTEEAARRPQSSERRRTERIERLLGGEPLDLTEFAYSFGGWHVALVASSPEASHILAVLARSLDAQLLTVGREDGTLWAWLAANRRLDPSEVEGRASRELPADVMLAIGEPGEGISGWRFSHRQARAAFSVALRGEERVVRYAGVALLTCALQDELLRAALRDLYLAPLEAERDGGATFRQTLRAYFAAERNVSSTAAALDVTRQTIKNRLQAIEQRLGASLGSRGTEIELAVALDAIDSAKKSTPLLSH